MKEYSIQKLAQLAGVSVRTLHHYDHIGLLTPATRTEKGYRLYGPSQLLRLQQILFYRELDLTLQQIGTMLDEEGFDTLQALKNHKLALQHRGNRIQVLLTTIDKTIKKLQGEDDMLTDAELYEGFPKEAQGYRQEAIEKYGEKAVLDSENSLKKMGKEGFQQLLQEAGATVQNLVGLMDKDPADAEVQAQIARHYQYIVQIWGRQPDDPALPEAYHGLAQLYLDDERFTAQNGVPNATFAQFMSKAMMHFADKLKQ
jgi:DNA-binding transcriptional MerR regulator